jgi:hypothetical protein
MGREVGKGRYVTSYDAATVTPVRSLNRNSELPGFLDTQRGGYPRGQFMESKTIRKRKKRTEKFKREAVRLLEERGERTVTDVAALGRCRESAARLEEEVWQRRRAGAPGARWRDAGGRAGAASARKRGLKQEREVLKKSIAVFASDRS